jgi:phosphohistidine swiveling domain-containing protein
MPGALPLSSAPSFGATATGGNSKAQALNKVKDRLKCFVVPDFLIFESDGFGADRADVLRKVAAHFAGQTVVVRSSASDEDGTTSAMAGEYDSILNVKADDPQAVGAAVDTVLLSYQRKGPRSKSEEVIVQRMVNNVGMSGVVFTHDLNTGAPYYVVNYDDVSGATDAVTSGGKYSNRTLYIHREALDAVRSERFSHLMLAVRELEEVAGSQFLDIEFAVGEDLTPYLLQVRAITTQPNWNRGIASRINATLSGIQTYVRERLGRMPGVYGQTTVFGQMPDWNPAEMIGRAPRALAYSLYRTLITDHAWRIGRATMGYAVPTGQPLMVSLAGQPFIDARLSFHSYLPASLPNTIAEKLVDVWVARLRQYPELHDKVEFEVAITAYSFDIDNKLDVLVGDALTASERATFKHLLREQLHRLLAERSEGSVTSAMARVQALEARHAAATGSAEPPSLAALHGMLDECQNSGTIPFAILARHGFIAKTILNSLCARGILDGDDVLAIQGSLSTVAGELVDWIRQLQRGEIPRDRFMGRFGHLRPGTYDILSRRYDQMPDLGTGDAPIHAEPPRAPFALTEDKRRKIDALLAEEGFTELNTYTLLAYVRDGTVGREYGKLVFTRTVSDILELIAGFGERHGLSREEMSHVPLQHLLDAASSSGEDGIEDRLRAISKQEAERHALSVAIRLPQVLFDEAGVHVVPFQVSAPNFITHKKVTAASAVVTTEGRAPALAGKIVLIENADPGFDWIFSEAIAGLITKYGGANSHMAIRCAEFGIPAAIGCGEQRFEALLKPGQIALDCSAGTINRLH